MTHAFYAWNLFRFQNSFGSVLCLPPTSCGCASLTPACLSTTQTPSPLTKIPTLKTLFTTTPPPTRRNSAYFYPRKSSLVEAELCRPRRSSVGPHNSLTPSLSSKVRLETSWFCFLSGIRSCWVWVKPTLNPHILQQFVF